MFANSRYILILAASLSLLASFVDNRFDYELSGDSLLYIHTARLYVDHGFQAALASYSWPFISILIGLVHQATGLSLLVAGHTIIAIFYALLTCTFISIVRDLGGSQKAQLLAMLVVIIFPTINDYRSYITRDAGYWLFSLLSLQQLLRFTLHNHYKHAFGWLLSVGLAIGFRTEGLFIAALAPLAILADKQFIFRERLIKTGRLYALLLAAASLAAAVVLATPVLNEKLRVVSELLNITTFFQGLFTGMASVLDRYASVAQSRYVAADTGVIIISGLIGLTLYTPLHALTFPYLVLLVWPRSKEPYPFSRYQVYLVAYVLIVLTYLLLLSFKKQFLTDRFCVLAALIAMLVLPFYVERIWRDASKAQQKYTWQKAIIILLLTYSALDSLISSGHSKAYIAEATEWVKANKPDDSRFMTNQGHIAVFGGNCFRECFERDISSVLKRATIQNSDYLAIQLKNKRSEDSDKVNALLATSHWQVIKSFSNERDDKVMILIRNP